MRESVTDAKRIVIKIGTKVLTEEGNRLSYGTVRSLVRQVTGNIGDRQFIIVSSGSIALGLARMGLTSRPGELDILQAAAAIGQSRLMHAYEEEFDRSPFETAQILLTREDIQDRQRYLNIRNTIFTLWSSGVIPIVNENDSVSFSEIRFGDNDILAAHLANMIDADLLLILTDIDGVYSRDPKKGGGSLIPEIPKVTSSVMAKASGRGSAFSSGGMESKLEAARVATKCGIGVIITQGKTLDLAGLLEGRAIGTLCVPAPERIRGRKKWIAFNPKVEGTLVIDRGGERAIMEKKKSLLPAGIREVQGSFKIGSNVSIQNEEHREIARGLSNFSSEEIERIKGLKTSLIPGVLGTDSFFDEVVHRDNLVILA